MRTLLRTTRPRVDSNSSARPRSRPCLCGIPDVPTLKHNSSSLVTIQVEEAGGKHGGELVARSEHEPVQVTFRFENLPLFSNANDATTHWAAILWRGDLYLNVPNGIAIERSKEAFVSLLEFAEEQLGCKSIVVCFAKTRPERNTLMRMFMFLGFVLLSPNHAKEAALPNELDLGEDLLFLGYSIA